MKKCGIVFYILLLLVTILLRCTSKDEIETTKANNTTTELPDNPAIDWEVGKKVNSELSIDNNIKVEWVAYESTLDFAQKNNLKSFEYGESYAFAIGANYLDYTKSNLFHIPNGGGSVSSGNNTNNATTSFDRPTSQKNQGSLEPLESRNRTATTSNQGNDDQGTIPEFTYEPRKYKRDRIQKENKPGNPETPLSYEDRFKSAIQSIQADIDKLCVSDECRDCSTNLCDPNEIRTRVIGMKARRPRPLDDGAMYSLQLLLQ